MATERATSRLGSSVLDLTVDDRAFNKGIKGAANFTKHLHSAFDKAGIKAEKLSGRIGGLTRSFSGLAGAGGIAGALYALGKWTQAAINNTIEMKVLAATAGVTTQKFQEYSFAARQAGISSSGLIDGLKELKLRVDEFAVTGYGPGAEAFRRMGYTASDFKDGLISVDDLFISVIETLRRIPSQTARLRIADEVFGGTGGEQYERLIRFLNETGQSMGDLAYQAHDLGIVLSDDLVNKTRETHIQFLKMKDVIGTQFARAILDALPPADKLADIMENKLPGAVEAALDGFLGFIDMIDRLNISMNDLKNVAIVLGTVLVGMQGAKYGSMIGGPWGAAIGGILGGGGAFMTGLEMTETDWVDFVKWLVGLETELGKTADAAGKAANELNKVSEPVYTPGRGQRFDETQWTKRIDDILGSGGLGLLEQRIQEYASAAEITGQQYYTQDLSGIKEILNPLLESSELLKRAAEELHYQQTDFTAGYSGAYVASQNIPPAFAEWLAEYDRLTVYAVEQFQQGGMAPLGVEMSDIWTQPAFQQFSKMMDDNSSDLVSELGEVKAALFREQFFGAIGQERVQQAFPLSPTAASIDLQRAIINAFRDAALYAQSASGQLIGTATGDLLPPGGVEVDEDIPQPAEGDFFAKLMAAADDLSAVFAVIATETGEGLLEAFGSAQMASKTLAEALGSGGLSLVTLAVTEVLTGLWEAIGPAIGNVIKPLVRILRALGRIAGGILAPVLTFLAAIVGIVEAAFVWLYNTVLIHVANAFIGLANAIIWLINTLSLGLAQIEYLRYLEPVEIEPRGVPEPPPAPGDEPGIPYELPGDRTAGDADGAGQPAQFRQQRPIHVYITFPGNVYAVGEGGFREFAELITEEQKKLGVLRP